MYFEDILTLIQKGDTCQLQADDAMSLKHRPQSRGLGTQNHAFGRLDDIQVAQDILAKQGISRQSGEDDDPDVVYGNATHPERQASYFHPLRHAAGGTDAHRAT
jgi:hypothetical protein